MQSNRWQEGIYRTKFSADKLETYCWTELFDSYELQIRKREDASAIPQKQRPFIAATAGCLQINDIAIKYQQHIV